MASSNFYLVVNKNLPGGMAPFVSPDARVGLYTNESMAITLAERLNRKTESEPFVVRVVQITYTETK